MLTVALIALSVAGTFGKDNTSASRAEEVLKQARAAVGGESKIGGVRGLSIKGKFRRVMGEREMSGEREFDLLLPDKYMRTESIVMPGMAMTINNSRAVSGQEFWSSGGRMGRPGGTSFVMRADGKEPTPEDLAKADQEQARQMRVEMARYVLALLLTPTPAFPLEFSYFGEATADDGSADVIDATGPEGFSARLFLDKQTHLPLMLSYRAPKPRVVTMMQPGGPRGGTHGGKTPEELVKEAQQKMKEQGEAKPEEVEMQIRFSDYKESGGLLLPHRIASGPDGETTEEWEIKSYSVNPQFKADKFQKK